MLDFIQTLDWTLLRALRQTLSCRFLDGAMPILTYLGDNGALWLIAVAALLCLPRYRRDGIRLLLGLALGFVLGNLVLKNLIARPRPCWIDESVRLLIANPTDFAFPSGHALSSAIAAVLLTKANRRFALAAVPLAALIALSRLYLFVHFPSDVLAAAALGIGVGLWTVHLTRSLFPSNGPAASGC